MVSPSARPGASASQLCELLGVRRPVLLAPMAKVAGGALAAAVSNAGGLGILGGGYGDPGWLDEQIRLAGGARVGIGVITWNMAENSLDAVLSHQPSAVWLAFGDLGPQISPIQRSGALAICQVATVEEAAEVIGAGADVVVAQGTESGGHGRPQMSVLESVAAISDAFPDVPLVAAGGIHDQADLDAAHRFGAAGAALGTAFYATHEAIDLDAAKQRLVDAAVGDTVRSRVYDHVRGPLWPADYDGRTLRTELTDEWATREDELADAAAPIQRAHVAAAASGDMSIRVVWAGAGVGAVTEVTSAADVVARFDCAVDS